MGVLPNRRMLLRTTYAEKDHCGDAKTVFEGDRFGLPVDSDDVLDRIVRVGRRDGVLLGYFFGPVITEMLTLEDAANLLGPRRHKEAMRHAATSQN